MPAGDVIWKLGTGRARRARSVFVMFTVSRGPLRISGVSSAPTCSDMTFKDAMAALVSDGMFWIRWKNACGHCHPGRSGGYGVRTTRRTVHIEHT